MEYKTNQLTPNALSFLLRTFEAIKDRIIIDDLDYEDREAYNQCCIALYEYNEYREKYFNEK